MAQHTMSVACIVVLYGLTFTNTFWFYYFSIKLVSPEKKPLKVLEGHKAGVLDPG